MIGLVTCFWVNNYGSSLQSYALQAVLDNLGYDNETINYSVANEPLILRTGIILRKLRYPSVRKAKLDQLKKKRKNNLSVSYKEGIRERIDSFEKFRDSNFKLSDRINNRRQLVTYSKKYSSIIVGSDQLWLPENIEEDYYTLTWVPQGKNKISYATSFGVSYIPNFIKRKAGTFLNKMNWISVRETSGVDIVRGVTSKKAEVVLDPTLLLTQNEWDELGVGERIIKEKYIFCYFLAKGDHKRGFADELKEKTGYRIVVLKHLDEYIDSDETFGDISPYGIGPLQFVNLIKYAEYICTDSFHGTVFSIINHKNFFTFNRYAKEGSGSTNTRLISLLNLLRLESRININNLNDISAIDYDSVDKLLDELRKKSISYLVHAIGKEK